MEIVLVIIISSFLVVGVYFFRDQQRRNNEISEELNQSKLKIEELEQQLEQQKIENLRFTLNPHSFRNTLNTIEHLAKNTYESVHSLSGIFDYMLYDATNKYVPLEQEINFAREYLNLYRLRLKPTVLVEFKVDDYLTEEFQRRRVIAPLISAHFIENAFKHGELFRDDAFIRVKLELLSDGHIVYSVRNLISAKNIVQKGGLGADSFKNRLQLLYNTDYELDYHEANNEFRANLKLKLYET